MAKAFIHPTYQFSQAAKAIGISDAALRNWLTRGHVKFWDDRQGRQWRTFTDEHIFRLAVVSALVGFGWRVEDAFQQTKWLAGKVGTEDSLPVQFKFYRSGHCLILDLKRIGNGLPAGHRCWAQSKRFALRMGLEETFFSEAERRGISKEDALRWAQEASDVLGDDIASSFP